MEYLRYLRVCVCGKKHLLSLIHRRIIIEAIVESIRESYNNPKPLINPDEFNRIARERQLMIINDISVNNI